MYITCISCYITCISHVHHMCMVKPLLTDISSSGHLPNNEQESMHQPYFPLLQYKHTSHKRTPLYSKQRTVTCASTTISHLLTDSVRSLVLTTPISRRIITELACNNLNERRTLKSCRKLPVPKIKSFSEAV